MESGVIDDNFHISCAGGASFYGRYFKCWGKHGTVDLHQGLVHSCDTFFYNVGNRLGIDRIAQYAEMVGYGHKTGIDLPHEAEGVVPSSRWKIRNFREKWYPGETISVSIGQGAAAVTPLQMAFAIGGMSIGGMWFQPHLVKDAVRLMPARRAEVNLENIGRVVSGMYGVVNEGGGTGVRAHLPGVDVCGKTGTAQLASNDLLKGTSYGAITRTTPGLSASHPAAARRSWWRRFLRAANTASGRAHCARCDQGVLRQESPTGPASTADRAHSQRSVAAASSGTGHHRFRESLKYGGPPFAPRLRLADVDSGVRHLRPRGAPNLQRHARHAFYRGVVEAGDRNLAGFVALWIGTLIDYHTLLGQVAVFYGLSVATLIATFAVGTTVFGSRRWICTRAIIFSLRNWLDWS